jgi:hypothetical protein
MAKNAKKREQMNQKKSAKKWHEDLRPETKKSILAVISFLFAAIFLLSFLGQAGEIGGYIYKILNLFFGKGYFFAPIVSILMGFSFIFSLRRKLYAATVIGAALFLLSSLGLLEIIFGGASGGYIGVFVAKPLLGLFDFWASLVIISSFILVSLLLTLNIPIFRTGGSLKVCHRQYKRRCSRSSSKKSSSRRNSII